MQDSITPNPLVTDPALDAVTSLLMGEEQPAEAPEVEPVAEQAAEPEVAEEAATEAKPEEAALDYGMKVPIKGGEPVTLGELKDAWQNQQASLLEVQDRENAILRKSQDIEQLLSFIDELPQGALELAKQRRQAMYAAEMPKLAAAIPGINTAEGAREVVKVMAEAAKDYGISEDELRMVMDSRFIKWMYDASRQAKAVREARNNVKPLRSDQPKAQHAATSSETELSVARAKQTGSKADQTRAIDQLLRSA
jgi:hypothetical protein